MSKVLIVGAHALPYIEMFIKLGYEITDDVTDADLVCFTGGADVHPSAYGEEIHPTTSFSLQRDKKDCVMYDAATNLGLPMVGICRGGQFLHVMNGGKLFQDVDGHALYGTHVAMDTRSKSLVRVTSTHHQMMRVSDISNGEVLCVAKEASQLSYMDDEGHPATLDADVDVEAMWYADTKCLCFQPHPELVGADSTYFYFKNLLAETIGA